MTVILMSRSEIDRMNVLRDLAEERIRVSEAATLIGLGRRQVLRLAKAFRQRGPAALASRRRGKPSNRSYPGVLRTEVTGIIRECYADFGPTLAGEKLAELHGIRLARETIRQWMMVAGLWKDRRQRMRPVHQPRHRRDCIGELIQIDGSQHWWFEGRGPQCTLLVYIDDATSRLMHLQFVETESTFDYFEATRAYLDRYGKPIAFYSDKHAVFRVNKKDAAGGDGMTQFGAGSACAQHRHHLCQFLAGQGPRGACERDVTGPAGEGDAAAQHRHCGGWQCVLADIHGRLQYSLRQGAVRRAGPASSPRRR